MKEQPKSKPIRFVTPDYKTLDARRKALAKERGLTTLSLPAYIMEASKVFEEQRTTGVRI